MQKIKNCPFCNAENTDAAGFIAHTDECYLMRRYMNNSSSKELAEAWDTRPIENELQERITELEHRLDTAEKYLKNACEYGLDIHGARQYFGITGATNGL